jgi:RNA polymerase II subunit A C-terminal domain phosphatase SSU72
MTIEEVKNGEGTEPKGSTFAYRPPYRNGRLRFAISCSSNMNRSMEAHVQLMNSGFNVKSFGSGTTVKLPGPSPDRPNIYEFDGPTYEEIQRDLTRKNKDL